MLPATNGKPRAGNNNITEAIIMAINKFQELLRIKKDAAITFKHDKAACALCPDMGGRVFGEVGGISLHRIDLDAVRRPDQPFANFGGGNFWPAPEGGKFGFNYRGNEWYVQSCINATPFLVASHYLHPQN